MTRTHSVSSRHPTLYPPLTSDGNPYRFRHVSGADVYLSRTDPVATP
jgi:hypothetical protein